MEKFNKKKKSVRSNLLFVIILMIIFNGLGIIAPIEKIDWIEIFANRILPVTYIFGFIYSYIMYNKDISKAANVEIGISIIMMIASTINLAKWVGETQITVLLVLLLIGYIVPLVLICDASSIKKMDTSSVEQVNDIK